MFSSLPSLLTPPFILEDRLADPGGGGDRGGGDEEGGRENREGGGKVVR